MKTQKKKPKNLQKREIFHIFAEGKAALGNLKASFHCARLHFLCRRKAALGNLKAAFIALVCITNILNYIIMLGTELPHVVQARAEGPEAPSPG